MDLSMMVLDHGVHGNCQKQRQKVMDLQSQHNILNPCIQCNVLHKQMFSKINTRDAKIEKYI